MACQANYRCITLKIKAILQLVWMGLFIVLGNAENPNEKLLPNKHAVRTIKTEYGEILDCVDIHKQPAFDHPLLKYHTLQMRPSSFPKGAKREASSDDARINLSNGGCPEGTIPILRDTQMQDLLKTPDYISRKKHVRSNATTYMGNITLEDLNHHHWAVIFAPQGSYLGTRVAMNVWPLQLADGSMFSVGQLWVFGGPADHLNTIEAGWLVDSLVFGDQVTRLFLFWTGDNYRDGCYNMRCPGYVHVNKNIAIGAAISPLSIYGGPQREVTLMVFKDPQTKNWWLTFGRGNQLLGYWPKELFPYLGSGPANGIEWGGETYNPTGLPDPPMGSGHFPGEGFGKASYMRSVQVVNGNNALVDVPGDARTSASNPQCYNVGSSTARGGKGWRRYFYFGGPGGNC